MSDSEELWAIVTIRKDGPLEGLRHTSWMHSRESALKYAEQRKRKGDQVVRISCYQCVEEVKSE